ncbi:hypothetical protein Enr10x_20920 [Gimesia panareensis]|uniref:Uncharacterized protein n=1 Tax=Gimesia panareensis TaxID=2527978 RepID=A0A517Q5C4_9PLAN|nr:hypothetical protein [Gimesia panareensis]QDT26782.1 hypothetical protein Enr10x_20920 [Gimesia panareensis]
MYYLKEAIGNCVTLTLWVSIIPMAFGFICYPFMLLGLIATRKDPMIIILLICTYLLLLITIMAIRIYLIFEKWDQIMSIKNKNKILELGNEGVSLLKPNYGWTEIRELRKQQKK